MITFAELLDQISWPDLKAALLCCYPEEANHLEQFYTLYQQLKGIEAQPSQMRIIVEETFQPEFDDKPYMEIVGRNGERNRDQAGFEQIREPIEPSWADAETDFTLSYFRWSEWLGSSIDPATLKNIPLAQIAAHCLSDMTFHGFEEEDAQEVLEEIKKSSAELDAMTQEERKNNLISYEELLTSLESKTDVE